MEDIIADKWYVVSSQGPEKGPYDTYQEAKAQCGDVCYEPMYGAQVIDTFKEEE